MKSLYTFMYESFARVWQSAVRWSQGSLPPGVHAPAESPPLECGQDCDLLLTHGIWQR